MTTTWKSKSLFLNHHPSSSSRLLPINQFDDNYNITLYTIYQTHNNNQVRLINFSTFALYISNSLTASLIGGFPRYRQRKNFGISKLALFQRNQVLFRGFYCPLLLSSLRACMCYILRLLKTFAIFSRLLSGFLADYLSERFRYGHLYSGCTLSSSTGLSFGYYWTPNRKVVNECHNWPSAVIPSCH